jgi:hypothetical protein
MQRKPELRVKEPIVVKELAGKLKLKPYQLIQRLMEQDVFTSSNQVLEKAVAVRVARELGYDLIVVK